MRYKIVRISYKALDFSIVTQYFVMKWTKKWYQFKPQWNYVKEWVYYEPMLAEYKRIVRHSIKSAEKVVSRLCKKVPMSKNIRIIECKCGE